MENVKKSIDLTQGRIIHRFIKYIIPLLATNLLQTFYNAADMMIVSLSSEGDSVGAIGQTGPFINLMLNVCLGFAVGANVIVAQRIGEKNKDATSKAVHTSIIASVLFGIVAAVIGIGFTRTVLAWLGLNGRALELAIMYTIIYFMATPMLSCVNTVSSIFRAKGDTKTPLIIISIAGVLNVLMNLFFVLVAGMSVDGVAIATLLSNLFSAVALLVALAKEKSDCKLSLSLLKIDKKEFKAVFAVGLPSCLQGMLFCISNMMIQSAVLQVNNTVCPEGGEYQPVIKGQGAANNIEGFLYNGTNSVYHAVVSFVGQNYGAKEYGRIRAIRRYGYMMATFVAIVLSGTVLLSKDLLLSFYGIVNGEAGSLDAIAYDAAMAKFNCMFIPYFTVGLMETGSGVLRGLGKSTTSALITFLGSCVLRIIWIETVFKIYPTLEIICIAYPITWTITAIAHFITGLIVLKKLKKKDGYVDPPRIKKKCA